jgi:hypothetical protein
MLLACSLAVLALSGSPADGRHLETTVQDDAVMLHSAPALVREAARRIAWLGADRVRITAGWSALAPDPQGRGRPGPPFDPADSRTYPREPWLRLDRAVKAADAVGLDVMLDVAFWAPRWAVSRAVKPADRQTWAPNPSEFGRFTAALARRYDGTFPDPERLGERLPAVRMWTTWNEPNSPTFLRPQWIRRHGRWQSESAHVYRAMHDAAYDALKARSSRNFVLAGGTAATGSRRAGIGGVSPLRFLRDVACVDSRLRPLAIPECRNYRPLRADGWAHHPYSRTTTPATSDPDPDDAPLADVGRLERLLDTLADRGRLARRLPLYETEYAYETNPPDPTAPFGTIEQARFMSWSTWLAWRDPDTRMFAQFLLRDIDPRDSRRKRLTKWGDFQTGLFFADGKPKPAVQAFRMPFWAEAVTGAGGVPAVHLFGGVRPGRAPAIVRVERRDGPGAPWLPVGAGETCDESDTQAFVTDANGWFQRWVPWRGPGEYRMSRLLPTGEWEPGIALPVSGSGALR